MPAMELAMVQVVENRADIDGHVVAIAPAPSRPDHHVVTIAVSGVAPVQGYPNLFAHTPGNQVDVLLPAALASSLQVGAKVRCRVRRGGPTVVLGEHCAPQ